MNSKENKMCNKIVGFLISPIDINFEFDFFKVGLTFKKNSNINHYIYLWGIGDLEKCVINNSYTLSFPIIDSLLDRNILISITDDQITIENDWLGSIPVFYNKKELIVSTIPNLCLKNNIIDKEGLLNYFSFGYSVFEHTPFEDVKFLRYFSKLIIDKKINIERKEDPILKDGLFDTISTPSEAIDSIKKYITSVEKNTAGNILLPTSGGLDSRLLNWGITEKSRIRSYTYGISKNQSKSSEVVYAEKLSKLLDTKWDQIELSHFNDYIDDWFNLFGFSTHLHGMYQIEFYKNILSRFNFDKNTTLLSGIFGDVWAGSVGELNISSSSDIYKLGFTHELNLNKNYLINNETNEIIRKYFDENKTSLQSHQFQVVSTIRIKLILISYLLKIPEYCGIASWTPFLNFEVATTMLRLPADLKTNRFWQKIFFSNVGLDLENMHLSKSKSNSLNFEMSKKFKFEPIEEKCFTGIIKLNKISILNSKLNHLKKQYRLIEYFLITFRIRGILRRLGIKRVGHLDCLSNYYVLKAVEKSFRKSNNGL